MLIHIRKETIMERKDQLDCSRRDFLKTTGIGVAALAFGGAGLVINANPVSAAMTNSHQIDTDVLVIGGGVAGIFAAIRANEKGAKVTLIDKSRVGKSGLSPFWEGTTAFDPAYVEQRGVTEKGLLGEVAQTEEYLSNMTYWKLWIDHSYENLKLGESIGMIGAKDNQRGPNMRQALVDRDIDLVERTMVTSLLKKDNRIVGAIGFSQKTGEAVVVNCKAVIMAAGNGTFKTPGWPGHSTTSDATAMAYRVGAEITGKEFVDYHVTMASAPGGFGVTMGTAQSMYEGRIVPPAILARAELSDEMSVHSGNYPIQRGEDAQREGGRSGGHGGGGQGAGAEGGEAGGRGSAGEGADGDDAAGPKGDSGGRGDESGGRGSGGDAQRSENGESGQASGSAGPGGGNGARNMVGGSSAGMAPHHCDGIVPADDKCQSHVVGLYAAGEAMATSGAAYSIGCTGSSNSFTHGALAGIYAAEFAKSIKSVKADKAYVAQAKEQMLAPREREQGFSPRWVTQILQGLMVPYYVLNVKEENRLQAALTNIEFLRDQFGNYMLANDTHELRQVHETQNMLLNAEMKLRAGLARTESRGSHFREEYPAHDDKNWLAWVILEQGKDGTMQVSKREIPDEWKPSSTLTYMEKYPNTRYLGEEEYIKAKGIS
jgi:succinate dehydrogenase/fumarate reductase flavoprotein subunit